ncbi:MAG: outer membrane protein assembly factor BamC [Gammaproteobacteria bacterium]
MRFSSVSAKTIALLVTAALLSACSAVEKLVPDRRADYKRSRPAPSLEIPPGLDTPYMDDSMAVPDATPAGSATFSEYAGTVRTVGAAAQNEAVLPQFDNMRIEREGDKRWLVVQATPAQTWNKVREFWLENGFLIAVEDPRVGVMETDWAENRADIPDDFIRSFIKKAFDSLYSAATRDKFRIRLEPGAAPGTTEIYLTHRGVEEVVQGDTTVWQMRPNDPELEAEMLRRLMVSMGMEEQRAKVMLASEQAERMPRAHLIKDADGNAALTVEEAFYRAWRRTGVALDRVGFTVEDRDRSQGVYYVRYNDPLKEQEKEGFLSKLAFWSKEAPPSTEYRISLTEAQGKTRIVVLDKDGNFERSSTATRILTLLHEQLQ